MPPDAEVMTICRVEYRSVTFLVKSKMKSIMGIGVMARIRPICGSYLDQYNHLGVKARLTAIPIPPKSGLSFPADDCDQLCP